MTKKDDASSQPDKLHVSHVNIRAAWRLMATTAQQFAIFTILPYTSKLQLAYTRKAIYRVGN